MAKYRFDDKKLRALQPMEGRSFIDYDDGDVRGFAVQVTPAGRKTFLLVYVAKSTGRERRLVIGEYGPAPALSVSAARERAIALRALVNAGRDPWQEGKETVASAEAARVRSIATVEALLAAYVAHLKAAGKPSALEVESSIARNLIEPFAKVAKLPADGVTVDDVMPALHRLTKSGKWRSAEKLAVYLRAAFNAAKAARVDAGGHAFTAFQIRSNPLQELRVTRPRKNANAAANDSEERKWALTVDQLRAYWARVKATDTPYGALLRFHLLTGGQRMEQLSRLTTRDLNVKAGVVTLWDTKGRRSEARKHVLPLLPDAEAALATMRPDGGKGPHLFTVSAGVEPAVPHTLAAEVRAVSAAMVQAKEIDRPITPGAIRRTVETLLGEHGVSKDTRAQLLSHGLSGVQDKNYDAGEYLVHKRTALELLRSLCEAPKANVTPIRRKAG